MFVETWDNAAGPNGVRGKKMKELIKINIYTKQLNGKTARFLNKNNSIYAARTP